VIWVSILGAAPFLCAPYANLFLDGAPLGGDRIGAGFRFAAILVYATELVPAVWVLLPDSSLGSPSGWPASGRVLGKLADMTSIKLVYQVCAFLR